MRKIMYAHNNIKGKKMDDGRRMMDEGRRKMDDGRTNVVNLC